MTPLRTLPIAPLLLGLAVVPPATAQPDERQLIVSVLKDDGGAPVTGLRPEDFVVREDGAMREVLRVRQGASPRQIAILVDTSQAADAAVGDFRRGLTAFIEAMQEGNQISIIAFGGPPQILVESTSTLSALHDGVGKIFAYPASASYLLDAMSETMEGFARREAERPVMVVLTTEGLDYSHKDSTTVLRDVQEVGVAVYAIVVQDRAFGPGVAAGALGDPLARWRLERERALSQGATVSGGHRRDLLSTMNTEQAMTQLAEELKSQHVVTYVRPPALIPPERIEVEMTRPGLSARATRLEDR